VKYCHWPEKSSEKAEVSEKHVKQMIRKYKSFSFTAIAIDENQQEFE
jgi:hypothetical protein